MPQGASVVARTESGDWVSLVEEGGTTTIKKTSAAAQHTKDESGLHEVEVSAGLRHVTIIHFIIHLLQVQIQGL